MPETNQNNPASEFGEPLLVLAATLLLVVSLSIGCKKAAPQTAVAPPPADPAVSNQPTERTPEEIALIDAAIKGDTAAVKELLNRGVNANTRDPDGRTPLTEAAYYGHTEIVKLLLDHGADVFARKAHGETAYDMAAAHQDIAQMIKRELDLLDAAGKSDVKLSKELLDKGTYANVRDPDGRTPLTEAVWNNNVELVKLLLAHGANVNARKKDGATPLSIAQGKAFKEIVGLLKQAGAGEARKS
jgi:uncharacterized protein